MNKSKPIILLASGNDNKSYLEGVPDEADAILEILNSFEDCEVVHKPFTKPHTLLRVLEEYENRIAIVHFAGHSDSTVWKLDGGTVYAKGLAKFLKHQHSIRLLFLNGCQNKAQVAAFVKAGVPAIIATSRPIEDSIAGSFACHFYESLLSNKGNVSIQEAYEKAKAKVEAETGKDFLSLEIGSLRKVGSKKKGGTRERVKSSSAEQGWAWGLYPKEGSAIQWKLTSVASPFYGLPPLPERDLPNKPFRGLEWFRQEHAELFFGRGEEIRHIYDLVTEANGRTAPIILFYGQSGVGKSSLLEAGLLPRLLPSHTLKYVRRGQHGLLETLRKSIAAEDSSLKDAWKALEKANDKPLLVILDQVEEVYTRPNKQQPEELELLFKELANLFEENSCPKGKLILGFRKEWLAELEKRLAEHNLPNQKAFLEPLKSAGVIEAITGPSNSDRLQDHYHLTIEEGLAKVIADDLLEDPDSPVAPTLQILLTKMWDEAISLNYSAPVFDFQLYNKLKREGILLGDFLDNQIKELQDWQPEVVNSGFILDLLAYHTTPLGTAEKRSYKELTQAYKHRQNLDEVIQKNQDLYLLADDGQDGRGKAGKGSTRLAHDTLAPLVRKRFEESDLPGQRARRILESRKVDWVERVDTGEEDEEGNPIYKEVVKGSGPVLSEGDLELVEKGKSGMRGQSETERKLVEVSRAKAKQARRGRQWLTGSLYGTGFLILTIAIFAVFQWWNAVKQANISLARQLGTQATIIAGEPNSINGELDLGLLLALHSTSFNDHPESYRYLTRVLYSPHRKASLYRLGSAYAFDPEANLMVIGMPDGSVRFRNVANNELFSQQLEKVHEGSVRNVEFSSDGQAVVTGGVDGSVAIWDAKTGSLRAEPQDVHEGSVRNVEFSSDGQTVVTGGIDGSVAIWDAKTGSLRAEPQNVHEGVANSIEFSSDGQTVVTVGDDSVAFWDITSGLPLTDSIFIVPNGVEDIATNHDSSTIVFTGKEGHVFFWDFSRDPREIWREKACLLAGRNLTQEEWQEHMGDRPYQKACPEYPNGP